MMDAKTKVDTYEIECDIEDVLYDEYGMDAIDLYWSRCGIEDRVEAVEVINQIRKEAYAKYGMKDPNPFELTEDDRWEYVRMQEKNDVLIAVDFRLEQILGK